jgi:hypothetical protein
VSVSYCVRSVGTSLFLLLNFILTRSIFRFGTPKTPAAPFSAPVTSNDSGTTTTTAPQGSGAYYDAMEAENRRLQLLQEQKDKEKKKEKEESKPAGMEDSMAKLAAMNGDFFSQM